jgi:hypothetical protein
LPVPPCPAVWQEPAGYVILATGTGTDGTLRLAVGPLTEDCVVVLKAHKDHSAVAPVSSDLQLSQAVAILVRPDLVPGLTLQLTRSPDGQSGSLLVQGGQPGVLYHFRRGSEASELGLPAYFHKVDATDASQNKGIGQLRIGTDVIVARDPPPVVDPSLDLPHRRPLSPVVELVALPADGTFTVMAVKARTGVGWSASRLLASSAPPNNP